VGSLTVHVLKKVENSQTIDEISLEWPFSEADGLHRCSAGDLKKQKYSGLERRSASVPLGSNSEHEIKSGSFIEFCAEIGMDFGIASSKWPKQMGWIKLHKFFCSLRCQYQSPFSFDNRKNLLVFDENTYDKDKLYRTNSFYGRSEEIYPR
jgi:hypothetical protein